VAALFADLPALQPVWMSHRDRVVRLPPGWRATASSPSLPVAAFESPDQRVFGLQFHPEVSHTRHGTAILDRFLARCGVSRTWDAGACAELLCAEVRAQVGDRDVFLLLSGGVDSLVTLAVLCQALGPDRVHSLHVDTGLMRLHESDAIMAAMEGLGFANLRLVRAEARFLRALGGVVDPEQKRRIIGRLFVEVVDDEVRALRLREGWLLGQGTIYPDRIESGATARADRIKTHHNRVDEIQRLIAAGRVVEPLQDLYKHEVRALGRQLGLPRELVERHPFPGPALGIRVLCSADATPPAAFQAEEGPLRAIAARHGLAACVLPVRSVGVQGDSRTYRHPAALWFPDGRAPDWEALLACAAEVVNRLPSLNRAVYAPADPRSFHLVPTTLTRLVLDLLRQVDHAAHQAAAGCVDIWQMPVVALPLCDGGGRQAFVLRPVTSRDAMTADVFRMPAGVLERIRAEIAAIPGAGMLLYDLTTKPPGTIEWE
jgi:GMP synthase (glutamine-hydrolysing)